MPRSGQGDAPGLGCGSHLHSNGAGFSHLHADEVLSPHTQQLTLWGLHIHTRMHASGIGVRPILTQAQLGEAAGARSGQPLHEARVLVAACSCRRWDFAAIYALRA